MKEELYHWIKNLAVFYIMFTAVLHLVPDKKYERYIRSFMGHLLIYMLCTPVLSIFGKSGEMLRQFSENYQREKNLLEQKETENLQAFYLNQGYESEIAEKITDSLSDTGIKIADTAVNIEGDRVSAVLYTQQELTEEEKGRVYDALRRDFGIEKENCRILAGRDEETAVGGGSSSGPPAGGDCNSGGGAGQPDVGERESGEEGNGAGG